MLSFIIFVIFCVGCYHTWQWFKKTVVRPLLFASMRKVQINEPVRTTYPRPRS